MLLTPIVRVLDFRPTRMVDTLVDFTGPSRARVVGFCPTGMVVTVVDGTGTSMARGLQNPRFDRRGIGWIS